ncbi:hypothetical protein [Paraburkholderia sediminicola]|uniref:hypothetical protein n=1 Tax=Paraburkholderia sediminicola TaxID=458836 RepID=UPI0038BC9D35
MSADILDSAEGMDQAAVRHLPIRRAVPPTWWTRPHVFVGFFLLPLAVLIIVMADRVIRNNAAGYKSADFITPFYSLLFLLALGLIAFWAFVASRQRFWLPQVEFKNGVFDFLFYFVLAAYLIWFVPLAVMDSGSLLGALIGQAGAVYRIRELGLNIPGVTTVTQFGIAYACIYGTKVFTHKQKINARYHVYMVAIVLLAIFRAVVNSERIAVLEIVIPLVVICGRNLGGRSKLFATIVSSFPLLTIFGAPIFFAAFEYNRSWVIYYQFIYDNIFEFAFERLSIYYVSSLNNICGLLDVQSWPTYTGDWTLRWLYRFPIVGDTLSALLSSGQTEAFQRFLENNSDVEFNNTTGILVVFQDWGMLGAAVFFSVYGWIAGYGYRAFVRARGLAQYIYPVVFYSLYEVLRIGYIYDGRCFSALVGFFIAYVFWGRRTRR